MSVTLKKVEILPAINHIDKDYGFKIKDLEKGLKNRVYEKMFINYLLKKVKEIILFSSALPILKGQDNDRQGRLLLIYVLQANQEFLATEA